MKTINFQAPVTIKAAAKGKRKLSILGYSGGILRGGSGFAGLPGIMDLAGMEVPASVPVNIDHNGDIKGIVGAGKPKSDGRALTVEVTLADTEAAEQVIALLESGVELQASLEAESHRATEYMNSGEEVTFNGQTFTVPERGLFVVSKSVLRGMAIVQKGADRETRVRIAASASKSRNSIMKKKNITAGDGVEEVTLSEARERGKRINQLSTIAAQYTESYPDSADLIAGQLQEAIDDDTFGARDFENWCDRHATRGPAISNTLRASAAPPQNPREVLAAATLLHLGNSDVSTKVYGERTTQRAADLRCHSLFDICAAAVRMTAGSANAHGNRDEILRASFSTTDLPAALSDAAAKSALQQYMQSPASWRTFAKVQSVSDFKSHKFIRPHWGGARLPRLAPAGELKHTTLTEEDYSVQANTFGEIVVIDRTVIFNDDAGVISQFTEALGRKGASTVSDLIWEIVLGNADDHFHEDNGNLTDAVLDLAGLSAAITKMRKQADKSGRPIDIEPRTLVVSPELEPVARQLLRSVSVEHDTSSAPALGRPTASPLPNLQLSIEPRISATAFTGNTTTGWYLFASPSDAPVIAAFLGGRDSPIVESVPLPINLLGVGLRGILDVGAALGDKRAAVMSSGDAGD